MKAYRLYNGVITEIEVDVDHASNLPLLPPDTTVDPRPDEISGFYLTIEGTQWKRVAIVPKTLDQLKSDKLQLFEKHRVWYYAQPVDVNGVLFDGDKNARDSLTQALTVYLALSYLPPNWYDYVNTPHPLNTVDDLKVIAMAVAAVYSTRYNEMVALRTSILQAADEAQLDAIVIPTHE